MPSAPTLTVSFGFGSTWKTADSSIVWTNVTDRVLLKQGVQVNRGRSSELDDFRAGTCSFVLDNSDRRFDPQHASATLTLEDGTTPLTLEDGHTPLSLEDTSGGYYGMLKPGVPVKIEATTTLATFPVFRGFVDGWPQDYLLGNTMAVVNITATDGFAKLATARLRPSPYSTVLAKLEPTRWYPLSDEEDAEQAVDLGSSPTPGIPRDSVVFDGADLDGVLSSATFTAGEINIGPTPATAEAWSFIFQTTSTTNDTMTIYTDGVIADGMEIGMTFGILQATAEDATLGSFLAQSPSRLDDTLPHHIVIIWNGGAGDGIWVDGVFTAASGSGAGSHVGVQNALLGADMDTGFGRFYFAGNLAHFALHDTALTSDQVADLYEAYLEWADDYPGARMERVLDIVGWPSDLRALATGLTRLGPADTNQAALPFLKDVERTEQGRLFIARDGDLVLRDRYYPQTVTEGSTSQATFSDDGSDVPYSNLGFDYDASLVFGRAEGSRVGGPTITVTASNTTDSEDTDSSLSGLQLQTDAQVRSLLEYRLDRYKEPALRARPIEIRLHGVNATRQGLVLNRELGHRVTVERTPQGVGSAISQETLIEGISHRISHGQWTTTFTLSPVDTRVHAVWGTATWGSGSWGY